MVKRMKKAKITCEVALVAKTTSSLGVCTRAKTMELKKSSLSRSTSAVVEGMATNEGDDGCYLQLRSRRLERRAPSVAKKARKKKNARKEKDIDCQKEDLGANFLKKPKDEGNIASKNVEGENGVVKKQEKEFKREEKNKNAEKDDFDEKDEGSFGENDLDLDLGNKERITRESTPSSFIVGSDTIKSPMSSKNDSKIKEIEVEFPVKPSAEALEEFFAKAERMQIEEFIKKYNFDPVNEKPLEGRYEWVKIEP